MPPSSFHPCSQFFLLIISIVLRAITVCAYTWSFLDPPTQCGILSINISGSDGIPPFRVLIIPFGPSPLNNVEVRNLIDMEFSANASQVQFQLPYPENSQLVAVVTDSTGFGSGGTSIATTVTASNDSSCFNPTSPTSYDFYFAIDPENQLVQCQDMRIFWDPALAEGTTNFLGVIPGGQSFSIPQGEITTVVSLGTGFTWTPSLRGGTTFILIGGDARGNGTAGMWQSVVSFGINDITNCLSDNSPSSTAGSPAGGIQTSTSAFTPASTSTSNNSSPTASATRSRNSNGSTTTIAIAGGVAGTLALIMIAILLLCLRRRRRLKRRSIKHPALNLSDESAPARPVPSAQQSEPSFQFQPQPSMISVNTRARSHDVRVLDALSSLPITSTRSAILQSGIYPGARRDTGPQDVIKQKGDAPPRIARGMILVQHEDAGPSIRGSTRGLEMVEIPPAYTELRLAAVAARRSTFNATPPRVPERW